MCNLSDGVEERGAAKGFIRGRAAGLTEGILSSIQNIMDSTGWSFEQAMAVLKIPDVEWAKYRELLQKGK